MAVVDRWSLFRGHLCNPDWDLKMVVVIDTGLLFGSGLYLKFDCIVFGFLRLRLLSQITEPLTSRQLQMNHSLVRIISKKARPLYQDEK